MTLVYVVLAAVGFSLYSLLGASFVFVFPVFYYMIKEDIQYGSKEFKKLKKNWYYRGDLSTCNYSYYDNEVNTFLIVLSILWPFTVPVILFASIASAIFYAIVSLIEFLFRLKTVEYFNLYRIGDKIVSMKTQHKKRKAKKAEIGTLSESHNPESGSLSTLG